MNIVETDFEIIKAGILSAVEIDPAVRDVLTPAFEALEHIGTERASEEQVELARRMYAMTSHNTVEVDDDAGITVAADGVWVQARLWVGNDMIDQEEDALEIGEDEL